MKSLLRACVKDNSARTTNSVQPLHQYLCRDHRDRE